MTSFEEFVNDGVSLGIQRDIVEMVGILRMSAHCGFGDPFYLHLDGDSGTGKSHAPSVLNQICGHQTLGEELVPYFVDVIGTSSAALLSTDKRLRLDNICWLMDDQKVAEGSVMGNFFLQAMNHCVGEHFNKNWTFCYASIGKDITLGKNLRCVLTYVNLPPALMTAGMGTRTLRARPVRKTSAEVTASYCQGIDHASPDMVKKWDAFWSSQVPHFREEFTVPEEVQSGKRTAQGVDDIARRSKQWVAIAAAHALFDGRTDILNADFDFADAFFLDHMPIWMDDVLCEFVPNTPDYALVEHILQLDTRRFDNAVAEGIRWFKEDMKGTKISKEAGHAKGKFCDHVCKMLVKSGYLRY